MTAVSNKTIPWQEREHLGNAKAFFMTMVEALISPIDYYEKLKVQDTFDDPAALCFMNSFYLVGPLISHILFWPSFLCVIFIVSTTTALLFVLAFVTTKVLLSLGEKTDYAKNFYVLAYATPSFVFVYVPRAGYWLAALVIVVLVGIGQRRVHKIGFLKILPTLAIASLLVLIPFSAVHFAQYWEKNHPVVDIEVEAQKVLAVISIAAENYAASHDGHYPESSAVLSQPPQQYLVRDYCGTTLNNYKISCDLRSFGYRLRAKPQGFQGRGKKAFFVTTGGKLREQ